MDIKYNGKTSELLSYKFSIARDPYNERIIVATIVSDHDRRGTSFVYDDRFPVRDERDGGIAAKDYATIIAKSFAFGPDVPGLDKWGFDEVANFLSIGINKYWTPLARAYASYVDEKILPCDVFLEPEVISKGENPACSDYDRFRLRHSMAV